MTTLSDMPLKNAEVSKHEKLCSRRFLATLPYLFGLITIWGSLKFTDSANFHVANYEIQYTYIALIISIPLFVLFLLKGAAYLSARDLLNNYHHMVKQLDSAKLDSDIPRIKRTVATAEKVAMTNHLLKGVFEYYQSVLKQRETCLRKAALQSQLKRELTSFKKQCETRLAAIKAETPILKAKAKIESSLVHLEKRRAEITSDWKVAYEQFSWWNQLKYDDTPDLTEMDKIISELKVTKFRLERKFETDYQRIEDHFELLKTRSASRVAEAKQSVESLIEDIDASEGIESDLLGKALWFSALSVPVSVWADLDQAHDVYDALREVNGNFADMSNAEIWWESLFMSSESLAGLASLTKGAYLEHLVAADTGGQLFEHFNNPDSDIVIDGIAYQIKATDSASYVNSVSDEIPVIATSEVAFQTGAIDSGYTNEELTNAVEGALGGSAIDIGDSAVDAVLSGLGGLGLFATMEGINHAATKYENGGDGVEAMFEGAGVAIEGTARALVGAAELSYEALTSRPSRFVGRALYKGLEKLDDKLMGQAKEK